MDFSTYLKLSTCFLNKGLKYFFWSYTQPTFFPTESSKERLCKEIFLVALRVMQNHPLQMKR